MVYSKNAGAFQTAKKKLLCNMLYNQLKEKCDHCLIFDVKKWVIKFLFMI